MKIIVNNDARISNSAALKIAGSLITNQEIILERFKYENSSIVGNRVTIEFWQNPDGLNFDIADWEGEE